jgi:hypothetical protein
MQLRFGKMNTVCADSLREHLVSSDENHNIILLRKLHERFPKTRALRTIPVAQNDGGPMR